MEITTSKTLVHKIHKIEVNYCGNCGINDKNQNLKTCFKCRNIHYCSTDCQKKLDFT